MKLSELKIAIPVTKPRNPNYRLLANKANAGGAHRDKKAELRRGQLKHKSQMHEEVIESAVEVKPGETQ